MKRKIAENLTEAIKDDATELAERIGKNWKMQNVMEKRNERD